jgi:CDP-6-deoxy-D-xylo-4-hexulose-3-dehydrase
MSEERRQRIYALIEEELAGLPDERHDPAKGHPLTVTPFGAAEVIGALGVMLDTHVTMGAQTRAFEAAWAAYCGRKYGVMVNSGSSANLLMLAALVEIGRLNPGDEVLVPAVSWSTSLFPIAQA